MLRIVFVMGLTCIANTWKKLYAFLRMRLIPLFLMQDRMQRHTDKPVRNIEREIQVHSSTKMLLAWAKPHQQSSVLPTEQKYPLEKWAVLWKTQFCCYGPFLYTQGTHLVRLVSPGLTHFLCAFDKCACASKSSCITCPGNPQAEPTIDPRLPDPGALC